VRLGQFGVLYFHVLFFASKSDFASFYHETSIFDWITLARYKEICQNAIFVGLDGVVK
jgi:hypothetical protein